MQNLQERIQKREYLPKTHAIKASAVRFFIYLFFLFFNLENMCIFSLWSNPTTPQLIIYSIPKGEEDFEIIKEDPSNPDTYKIICADQEDTIDESNYEIQNENNLLEIYEFHDDECVKKSDPTTAPIQLSNAELKKNIALLLKTVVDVDVLTKFGYPKTPIEKVLNAVIKQCGQSPIDSSTCPNFGSKLRENVKLLFTSVIDDESIKEMLNNHTIDEVICHVIKLSESS